MSIMVLVYMQQVLEVVEQKEYRGRTDANGKWHTTKGQHAQPFWEPAIDAGRAFFNKYF